jgi:hypothetical protein
MARVIFRRVRGEPPDLLHKGLQIHAAALVAAVVVTEISLEASAHPYYCAPLSFRHMPDDLAEAYASAAPTIMKGDLNYRRLVGDCAWPATTPFAVLTAGALITRP